MNIVVVTDRIKAMYPRPIFKHGDEGSLWDTYNRRDTVSILDTPHNGLQDSDVGEVSCSTR